MSNPRTGPVTPPVLDVRAEAHYAAGHLPGSANIPLEAIGRRVGELPPPGQSLIVVDADLSRAEAAAALLGARRYPVVARLLDVSEATETGRPRTFLWRPSPFLVEAMGRIEAERGADWPAGRRGVDAACGGGREAVWLAMRGMEVDAIDLLDDALAMARALADRWDVGDRLRTLRRDLVAEPHLVPAAYDLAVVFRFLHRPLLPALAACVRPGGYVVYETFHTRTPAAGHKPRSPEHLLTDRELPAAFSGFEVLIARDAVERDGRYFSQFLGRRR